MAWTLLTELVANALGLLLALLLAQSCAQAFGFGSARGSWLVELGWPGLATLQGALLALAGLALVKGLLDYIRHYARGVIAEEVLATLRNRLFIKQLQLPWSQYAVKGGDRFLLRHSGELNSLQNLVTRGVIGFTGDLALVVLSLVVISVMLPVVGLALTLLLVLLSALIGLLNRQATLVEARRRDARSSLLARVSAALRHIATIQAFNRLAPEVDRYTHKNVQLRQLGAYYHRWAAWQESLIPLGIYLSIAVALWLAVQPISQQATHSGSLLAIAFVLVSWRTPLQRLYRTGLVWQKGQLSWQKLQRLLAHPPLPDPTTPLLCGRPTQLSVHQLGLRQTDSNQWLWRQLSFDLQPGQAKTLVIPCGKTTLVRTLAGLITPTEGQLSLDGYSLEQISAKQWRKHIAWVSADAFPLYGRTIFQAVSYGKSERYRTKALKMWQLWQTQLPELAGLTLDTPTATLGRTQLLVLQWMRAALTGKPFWVLDDPFTGLPSPRWPLLVHLVCTSETLPGMLFLMPAPLPESIFLPDNATSHLPA